MKGLAVILIFVMLAGALSPCVLASAQVSTIPHEDPNAAQNTLDSLSFLTQYAGIFALMSSGHYDNASQLSKQLSYMTVPSDLSYVINKYNDLTQQLITQLNDLDSTLNNASSLLDQYRLREARDALDHAGVGVAKAQILLSDLMDATTTVTQKLGVLSAAAGSQIQQAYSELRSMLARLQDLIDRYYSLLEAANQRYQEIQSVALKTTTLTLKLNATACFVGGHISASGALTVGSQVLANRAVTLLLDGAEASTVNTGSDGSYHATIKIPYKYVDSLSVSAYFTPTGNDKGTYLGSTSPTLKVKVLYYHTILNVSAPSVAYPGLSLRVAGNVTAQNGNPLDMRHVKVLLDGAIVLQETTDANGTFTGKFTLGSLAKLGVHTLTVTVESSGLYAGTTLQRNLTVTKMATTVEVNAPSFVMLPSQLQINGTVKSAANPLSNATVIVEFADVSTTIKTLNDGSFETTLNIPFSSVFVGEQTLKVAAQPTQPWQAIATKNSSVFVLNSVSTGLTLAVSLSVVFIMYFRFAKTRPKRTVETDQIPIAAPAITKEAPVTLPTAIVERNLEGFSRRVLKAYIGALAVAQSATGSAATPTMTLREYQQTVGLKLGEAQSPFTELTVLAEKALYSAHPTEKADSERAEELASTIRRKL
jgi:hypothetical protein